MNDCPRYNICDNADTHCHICRNFSAFSPGTKSHRRGRAAEKKVVTSINTKATLRKASGAMPIAKGDVIDDMCLHEVKTGYGTKSMTLQRSWLTKIRAEALAEGKIPVLDIIFTDSPNGEIWSIVDSNLLQDLLQEIKDYHEILQVRPPSS